MNATLVICPRYPLPERTGADMRTMHFVRYFRQLGPVDIAHILGASGENQGRDVFREGMRLDSDAHARFRRRFFLGILSDRPPQVYRFQESSRRTILNRITSCGYDHILVRYVRCTAMLWGLSPELRRRVILDFDDILSGSLSDSFSGADEGLLKRALRPFLRHWMRRYEDKCLQFGATLVCSETDRAKLYDGRHRPPYVVPNVYQGGNDFASFSGEGFDKGHHLLFVGTLGYGPNAQGLRWFLESIFPGFRRAHPDAKLSVVGRAPSAEVRALCEHHPGVQLHADVPDLRPFYRNARAVVVPLLAGGGTRIKILEAAAARRPVLSTPIGAEGLELHEDRDILIFRDEREFLAKYEKLTVRCNYKSLVDRARHVVGTKYSTQAFNEILTTVLADLNGRQGPAYGGV